VVLEEMLAAGAPGEQPLGRRSAERAADPARGSEQQKKDILPRIAAGELAFCIGMSEPDSGSDLASVRTRATPVDGKSGGGFLVNGTKLWTSNAHRADYMILLARTGEAGEQRHGGLTQFLVALKETKGISIRPVPNLAGDTISTRSCSRTPSCRRPPCWRGGQRLAAGDERARLRALGTRALSCLPSHCWWSSRARARARAAPSAGAWRWDGWSRTSPRCAGCRARWPACCRRAPIRRSRPRW
jgi:hypothetical protein